MQNFNQKFPTFHLQDPQIDSPGTSNAIVKNLAIPRWSTDLSLLLPLVLCLWYCSLPAPIFAGDL